MNYKILFESGNEDVRKMIDVDHLYKNKKRTTVKINYTAEADCYEASEVIARALADVLPHGSGIDYKWKLYQMKGQPTKWIARNSFHAMDEAGGYCHVHDFKVIFSAEWLRTEYGALITFLIDDVEMREHHTRCCGMGLHEYITDTMYAIESRIDYW